MSDYDVWVGEMQWALHWHSPAGGSGAVCWFWQRPSVTPCGKRWYDLTAKKRQRKRLWRHRGEKSLRASLKSDSRETELNRSPQLQKDLEEQIVSPPWRKTESRLTASFAQAGIHPSEVMWFSPWPAHTVNTFKISILFIKFIHSKLALCCVWRHGKNDGRRSWPLRFHLLTDKSKLVERKTASAWEQKLNTSSQAAFISAPSKKSRLLEVWLSFVF